MRIVRLMIVYREQAESVESVRCLHELQTALTRIIRARGGDASHGTYDEIIEFLIGFGSFESGVADSLMPEQDGVSDLTNRLRRLSALAGRIAFHSWDGNKPERDATLERLAIQMQELAPVSLPQLLRTRIPEGYQHYGLAPETYIESARRYALDHPAERRAVCIGIRTIGTSLSGVVAGVLEALGWSVRSVTLRPRGHPYERTLSLTRTMDTLFDEERSAAFLIVDEGPGLSGSSFAAVSEHLSRLGIDDRKIVLFPSWLPEVAALRSQRARSRWLRHSKYCTDFNELFVQTGKLFGADERWNGSWSEVSAGAWRPFLYREPTQYPAVHPQHEKRKYLVAREEGAPLLYRFAGYGSCGREKLARARTLEEHGFGAKALDFRSGFLISEFVAGSPLSPESADPHFIRFAADYLSFISRRYQIDQAADKDALDGLIEMVCANVREGLDIAPQIVDRLATLARTLSICPAVRLDGRMLPHEWIRTPLGCVKTDALDHGDDHFFPGSQDPVWDAAALSIEFQLDQKQQAAFFEHFSAGLGIDIPHQKVLFYKLAYLAFRTGYTSLAAETLAATDEGPRFRSIFTRYSSQLRNLLGYL